MSLRGVIPPFVAGCQENFVDYGLFLVIEGGAGGVFRRVLPNMLLFSPHNPPHIGPTGFSVFWPLGLFFGGLSSRFCCQSLCDDWLLYRRSALAPGRRRPCRYRSSMIRSPVFTDAWMRAQSRSNSASKVAVRQFLRRTHIRPARAASLLAT